MKTFLCLIPASSIIISVSFVPGNKILVRCRYFITTMFEREKKKPYSYNTLAHIILFYYLWSPDTLELFSEYKLFVRVSTEL